MTSAHSGKGDNDDNSISSTIYNNNNSNKKTKQKLQHNISNVKKSVIGRCFQTKSNKVIISKQKKLQTNKTLSGN